MDFQEVYSTIYNAFIKGEKCFTKTERHIRVVGQSCRVFVSKRETETLLRNIQWPYGESSDRETLRQRSFLCGMSLTPECRARKLLKVYLVVFFTVCSK